MRDCSRVWDTRSQICNTIDYSKMASAEFAAIANPWAFEQFRHLRHHCITRMVLRGLLCSHHKSKRSDSPVILTTLLLLWMWDKGRSLSSRKNARTIPAAQTSSYSRCPLAKQESMTNVGHSWAYRRRYNLSNYRSASRTSANSRNASWRQIWGSVRLTTTVKAEQQTELTGAVCRAWVWLTRTFMAAEKR